MEIILLEHVDNLGKLGDIVVVKDGYARNFLLPQKKCLRATVENKAVFAERKAHIEKELADHVEKSTDIAKKIENKFVVILRQAGEDGRLFGSVSVKDIATAITASLTELDKKYVKLDKPVKYVGVYPIKIKLCPEVVADVRVIVARTEDEAREAENNFLNPKDGKKAAAEGEVQEGDDEGNEPVKKEKNAKARDKEKKKSKGKGDKSKAK